MDNTVENNRRLWGEEYHWKRDGEEWTEQAEACGQPYERWKESVVETFLKPHIQPMTKVVEIGAGHGRWTAEILALGGWTTVVDLNKSCIDYCRSRFADRENIAFLQTDGSSLMGIADGSIEFIWSYDVFVHLDASSIRGYFHEFRRVLAPGGRAVVHHAGRRHGMLRLAFLRKIRPGGCRIYRWLSMRCSLMHDGWRSNVSRELVRELAQQSGLGVVSQLQRWGPAGKFGVPQFGDWITTLATTRS